MTDSTPFLKMEEQQSASNPPKPVKARRCAFCALGSFSTLLLIGTAILVVKSRLDSKGLQITFTSKNDNVSIPADESEVIVPEEDGSSEYILPKDPITDPDTSISFPAVIASPSDGKPLIALGAGMRQKEIGPIKVKIYSACLYVDPARAREDMRSFEGKSAAQLRESTEYFDAIRDATFDRAIRIVIKYKEVSRAQMTEGLVKGLSPRLHHLVPDRANEILAKFEALFTESKFVFADTILLSSSGDRLSLAVNGDDKSRGVDDEPFLVRAFFGIYTDSDTNVPVARSHFADRFPLLFERREQTPPASLEVLEESQDTLRESATDQQFPLSLTVEEKPANKQLLLEAAGVTGRTKNIIPIFWSQALYGVGLYINREEWANATANVRIGDLPEFVRSVSDITKAIRVQMARDIDSGTVVKAFADAFKPILKNALTTGEVDEALCMFRNLFTFDMHQGQVVFIHCSTDGSLYSVVNQLPRLAITKKYGQPLCAAVLEVYLGQKSVLGNEGRQDLVKRL